MKLLFVVTNQKLLTRSNCSWRKQIPFISVQLIFKTIHYEMCFFEFPTSYMQTVEKTGDFLPTSLNTGDERQSRPEESVTTFGEAQEHYSSVSVQIFH